MAVGAVVLFLLVWLRSGKSADVTSNPTTPKLKSSTEQVCPAAVPSAGCTAQNTGLPTTFFKKGSFRCEGPLDDGLGRNKFPATLPMQLYPEDKMHLVPFPEPSLVAEWQRSRIDPSSNPAPVCDDFGACTCADGKLFDGRKCIPGWGGDPYKALRERWASAPLKVEAKDKTPTTPAEYAKFWEKEAMFGDAWTAVHAGQFRGKKVLDVGAGYARQSFVFALHGAYVTHLDVVPKNLERIGMLAKHYGIEDRVRTVYLSDVAAAEKALEGEVFDVILFFGSMHHMPREYIRKEAHMYFKHMRVGSRLIQLAYPSSRWFCYNGGLTFPEFCAATDFSCPWAEWYDLEKALSTFHPFKFNVQYAGVVGPNEFTWWDLVLTGKVEDHSA